MKLEDAGEYSCEAENVLGKDTAKGSLNVRSGKLRHQRLSGDSYCLSYTGRACSAHDLSCVLFNTFRISSETISGDKEKCSLSINVYYRHLPLVEWLIYTLNKLQTKYYLKKTIGDGGFILFRSISEKQRR